MIEQALEDGEITEVLIGEVRSQIGNFFRYLVFDIRILGAALIQLYDLFDDVPVEGFDLSFGTKIENAEIERVLRIVFDLQRVMERFARIRLHPVLDLL